MKEPRLTLRTSAYTFLLLSLLFIAGKSQGQSNQKTSTHLVSNKEATSNAEPQDHVFLMVDQAPQFPGGDAKMKYWIMDHAHFPPETPEKPLAGKIVMQFIVEKDGSLKDIKVVSGIADVYNKECKRVFSLMPKWKPGKDKGRLVRTLIVIPIKFSDET